MEINNEAFDQTVSNRRARFGPRRVKEEQVSRLRRDIQAIQPGDQIWLAGNFMTGQRWTCSREEVLLVHGVLEYLILNDQVRREGGRYTVIE